MTATALTIAKPQPYSLAPTNFDEAERFAKLVANSSFAPKGFAGKPGDVLVAMQMGAELGLSPMQALQNIAVINGRPSLWGDAMLAVCMAHPSFVDIDEHMEGDTAVCIVKRKGRTPVTRTFSKADAKAAGLLGKQGPWSQYEPRMMQMRARGFALRDAFPDVLRGMNSAEESADLSTVHATVVESHPLAPMPADPISRKLQESIDAPAEDPALAAMLKAGADYAWPLRGKNHDKPLSKMSDSDLVYYSEKSQDPRLRAVAGAEVDRRIAAQAKAFDESTKGSYLDGAPEAQGEEVSP